MPANNLSSRRRADRGGALTPYSGRMDRGAVAWEAAPSGLPANTVAPVLSGAAAPGSTLTTTAGTFTGTAPLTYSTRWQRSTDGGATWAVISGQSALTYVTTGEADGTQIRAQRQATNAAGSSAWASSNVIAVASAAVAPARTTASTLTRTGDTISSAGSAWTGTAPLTYQYGWQRRPTGGGTWTNIPGFDPAVSVANTFDIRPEDAGYDIRMTERALNSAGSTGNLTSTNFISIAAAVVPDRVATATSQQLLFAGNSFTQTPNGATTSDGSHGGNLVTNWPGGTQFDFVSFGTLEQVWDLDGNLRNDMDWNVLVMSETPPSLETGYPTPGGDVFTQTSFQHAFWFAEEARRRNADVVLLVPWTPTGAEALRPNIAGWFTFLRNWIAQKTGRPVWLFPAHLCVKAMQDAGAAPISGDGLHLDHAYSRVLSGALWYMLNQTPYPFVISGFEALDAACRDVIDDYRWAGLGGTVIETAVSASDPLVTPAPLPRDVVAIAGTLTNPPVSARLGIINERSARPFINAFKQAWEWEGNNTGGNWAALLAAGRISAGGQILSMPTGSDAGIRTRALDSLVADSGATGRWRLTWTGAGTFDLFGVSGDERVNANTIEFDYTANGNSWITVVARSAPISNIKLVHQADWAADAAGQIFRQQYLDEVRNYRCLRFDEWSGILRDEPYGLAVTTWASRPLPTDETFQHRFVPLEWQAALCNLIGADLWMCAPTAATADYDTGAATLIQSLMPAPRHVYAEYSTKTWDFAGTPQAHYCAEQGRIAFGTTGSPTEQEFRSWYGMRSALMAQRWRAVWGSSARLHMVIQHQADWVGGEFDVLVAPMWRDANRTDPEQDPYVPGLPAYVAPHSVCDMLTVHAQIDGGMAYGSAATLLETWRTTLTQTVAFNRIRDQMLTGPYHNVGDDGRRTVQLLTPKWQHYRTVANTYGMELGSYEVGNHLNGVGGSEALQSFMHAFSVSSQMAEVYTATFAAIRAAGFDGPLCMAVECRFPDANIMHGLQRYLGDHNPAWTAVNAINVANDGPAGRSADAFVGTAEV